MMSFSRAPHYEGFNNKKNNMKVTKTTKPAIKTSAPAPAPAVAKRTVSRGKVLRQYTVAELETLIGRDTKVDVSFKSLKAVITAINSEKVLASLG